MGIFIYLLLVIYLFFPTFVANAVPVLIKNVKYLKEFRKPIHEKLLGKNKTWRGLIFGILGAIGASIIQYYISPNIGYLSSYYRDIIPSFFIAMLFGFLQGFGALFGDAIKSLIKRKIGIKPGKPWPVFDGIDYIIGSLIFSSFIFSPNIIGIVFLLVIAPLASLIANSFSYMMGWKDVWR